MPTIKKPRSCGVFGRLLVRSYVLFVISVLVRSMTLCDHPRPVRFFFLNPAVV
jgi:hypothetical protein